ncbi:MAG: B12-binding domain-containing radical SAM protein [Dysgonamonadaceae bacterium]|nr:B12-binding domain-containing radical SAM protein [Dysgonamonadaceae bacterium]
MMTFTFLTPPSVDPKIKPAERTAGCTRVVYDMPNIYSLTIAAILEKMNFAVKNADFVLDRKSFDDFQKFVKRDTADCYCFWSVNLAIETDLEALKVIRQHRPDVWVLFMGPAPTYYPQKFLTDERTIVLRGEAETTIHELATVLANDTGFSAIRGISFLKNGEIVNNPPQPLIKDLDTLPYPARHLVNRSLFSNPKLKRAPYTAIVTSRNCPFHCIYCVPSSLTFARELENRATTGKKPFISARSTENVIAEIDLLAAEGYKAIGIMDDNFITTEERLRPIAERLKHHDIVWGCQARADAITEPIARILGENNCLYVDIGVESFNDEILQYIKKRMTRQQIIDAIKILKKYNVPVKLNILLGSSPLETRETVRDTIQTAMRLDADQVMLNIVAPFPGTEFYTIAKENGWIVGGEYTPTDVQHHSILNYKNLSSKELERMLFWYNIRFFLRPKYILMQMKRFNSFSEFIKVIKALKIKLLG